MGARITQGLLNELHLIIPYDMDHLPVEIKLIEALRKRYPKLHQVPCFDTAFHSSMLRLAQLLPIPHRFVSIGIQRYAFHGYPWLVHRLTYRSTNHENMYIRGNKEEGTIKSYFDMTVLNDLDRFHLVQDVINRFPQLGASGAVLKKIVQDKLVEHKLYIDKNGVDMPEILNWKWNDPR